MKNGIGNVLKWLAKAFVSILVLIAAIIIFFDVQAALRETKTPHEAAPSTGRFVQAGDAELFIQEMGPPSGPVLILIHGTAAWSGLWRETMTRLSAAGYHCIAIDIPPFGYSERPAGPSYGNADQAKRIVALMDALEVEHAILLGHSFGGGATVETALSIPDRIDALVLADAGGLNLNIHPTLEASKPSAMKLFLETPAVRNPVLAATATNPLFTRKLISSMLLDPADATDEKIKILQEPLVLKDATNTLGDWLEYVLTVQEVSLTSDPANYQTLTMPTLIIWGDSDTVIPLEEGKYLNSIIPNSQLVVMKGVNHVPHVEDIDQFTEIVSGFLDAATK